MKCEKKWGHTDTLRRHPAIANYSPTEFIPSGTKKGVYYRQISIFGGSFIAGFYCSNTHKEWVLHMLQVVECFFHTSFFYPELLAVSAKYYDSVLKDANSMYGVVKTRPSP